MIVLQSSVHVANANAGEIFDFLTHPTDALYQKWWPGTHLQLHLLDDAEALAPTRVYMDERIGDRRLRMTGIVVEAKPGRRLVWQLEKGIRLPVWLVLELNDQRDGVTVVHTIRAGFSGLGRTLDPLFRLYFSDAFARTMDEHVRTEFPKLRDLLRAEAHT